MFEDFIDAQIALPDLTITDFKIEKLSGSSYKSTWNAVNIGEAIALSTNLKLYLSKDSTFDKSDVYVGIQNTGSLNPGQSRVKSRILSVKPGCDYLVGVVDPDNKLAEGDELNNAASVKLSQSSEVLPDLIVGNLSVSNGTNNISKGYGFTTKYSLSNQGNAIAPATSPKYTLSKDDILGNADDITPTSLSGTPLDQSIASGVTRIEQGDYLAIYNDIQSGTYNLFVSVDGTNVAIEGNESNNTTSTKVLFTTPPIPDLVIERLDVPAEVNIGGYLNLSYRVNNIDSGYSGYTNIAFYLSKDDIVDTGDLRIDPHLTASSVGSGSPVTRDRSIFLDPSKILEGNYKLIAMVDPTKGLSESNESNNTLIKDIFVGSFRQPDLSIESIATQYLYSGGLNSLHYSVKNGGSAVTSTQTTFYLSDDGVYNTSDVIIGTKKEKFLGENELYNQSASVYLNPSLVKTTQQYLIVKSDAGLASVVESNELNNDYAIAVSILPSNEVYSASTGYGLIDASKALAVATGVDSLIDVPNADPNWGINQIKAQEAWNAGYTGQGITVAVIDTGVDYTHPDLIDNIWSNTDEVAGNSIDDDGNGFIDDVRGWNFVSNDNTPTDTNGHGTHVAGIIAASSNAIGRTGVAYNSKIMPLKVLGGGDEWGNVSSAIRYAVDNGARVINMSLGGSTTDQDGRLKESLQYASDRGVIVVSAAGNYSGNSPIMPASYATEWGLAVGATNSNETLANYSNRSGQTEKIAYVTAPGSSASTYLNGGYKGLSGTSMASPHVAGVVALMLCANPSLTDADIRQILTMS